MSSKPYSHTLGNKKHYFAMECVLLCKHNFGHIIVIDYRQPHFTQQSFSFILVGKVSSKSKEDAPYELESQFILRLPSVR